MKLVKQGGIVVVAILLIAISINMFLAPHNIAAGGVSGLGILVEQMLQINRSYIVLFLNIIMLIFAYKLLGKEVFVKVLSGSLMLPLFLYLIPNYKFISDTILSVIFGSMIFGAGVSLLYKIDASSGGTTIPPMILKKYFGLNQSLGLLLSDLIIVTFNIYVFGIDEFFLAVLSLIITSLTMSYLETAFHQKKVVLIQSKLHLDKIKEVLLQEFNQDINELILNGNSNEKLENMLMMVVDKPQIRKILSIIDLYDPSAFVIIHKASQVHGLRFTYQNI